MTSLIDTMRRQKYFKGNTIVRVYADNPFVDSEQINLLVNKFKKNNMITFAIIKISLIVDMPMVLAQKYFL